MIPPMVSTYAPSIALWVLVFLTVRGLLWAIWATLLRPAKNIKKTYVRGHTSAEHGSRARAEVSGRSFARCVHVLICPIRCASLCLSRVQGEWAMVTGA